MKNQNGFFFQLKLRNFEKEIVYQCFAESKKTCAKKEGRRSTDHNTSWSHLVGIPPRRGITCGANSLLGDRPISLLHPAPGCDGAVNVTTLMSLPARPTFRTEYIITFNHRTKMSPTNTLVGLRGFPIFYQCYLVTFHLNLFCVLCLGNIRYDRQFLELYLHRKGWHWFSYWSLLELCRFESKIVKIFVLSCSSK